MSKIDSLRMELQQLAKLGSAIALLGWDEEVNLPQEADVYRGEVNAFLSAELHKRFTDKKLASLIDGLAEGAVFDSMSADEQVIVRETKRDLDQARKIPADFVERMAQLSTKAFSAWRQAREKSDFSLYAPILSEIIEMKQQETQLLGYKDSPYDALLDEFEPGLTAKEVETIFTPLAEELSKLILSSADHEAALLPSFNYPLDKQAALNREVVAALGYDLAAGRIDVSPHPFSVSFHPTDVRVTTRYDESDFWVSLGSTIHEVGHAMYEQGLPVNEHGTPLGEAASLGIHESQSRSWENLVGKSREFSTYLYPLLTKHFGKLPYDEGQLYIWLNRINPSPIRVEADEVTYNMHVVLRFELEKQLIEGRLAVADLPAAWNQKMKQYLGIDIKHAADGVLQDVHWAHGAFGYFPTYTLGNIYAAQLFEAAKAAHPQMVSKFAMGDFKDYLDWLRANVHIHGRRYQPAELIEKVTGRAPSSGPLLTHLETKLKLHKI